MSFKPMTALSSPYLRGAFFPLSSSCVCVCTGKKNVPVLNCANAQALSHRYTG